MKIIDILVALIASGLTTMIYLPVEISGGLAGLPKHNGRINGFSLLSDFNKDGSCMDCFNYEVRWNIVNIQLIVIFIIMLLLLIIIDKRRKKKWMNVYFVK